MRFRTGLAFGLMVTGFSAMAWAKSRTPQKNAATACRAEVVEGELNAGRGFEQAIGDGLKVWFQPIASGWILRVIPVAGPSGDHDYAELATPPYRSVSPLSLSTDFAFRAQDAVGWNPRRFRFATSESEFQRLDEVYERYESAGATPPATLEVDLSVEVAKAAEGKLTILDAKLIPGLADQWKMAAAVSSRFPSTAHTLVNPADGKQSALGKLIWVRFRLELDLPPGFKAPGGSKILPHVCGGL
jgi:hypothetical protein